MHKITLSTAIGTVLVSVATFAAEDNSGDSSEGMPSSTRPSTEAELVLEHIAQDGGSSAFATLDADGDRKVSYSEAQNMEGLTEIFTILDRDGDGMLSANEFSPRPQPPERKP